MQGTTQEQYIVIHPTEIGLEIGHNDSGPYERHAQFLLDQWISNNWSLTAHGFDRVDELPEKIVTQNINKLHREIQQKKNELTIWESLLQTT